jgi:thiol-disulfide isomerase/thioredoxin
VFNKLFEAGISYDEYSKRSDKLVDREKGSWDYSVKAVRKLSNDKIDHLNQTIRVLCITENWCPDCANGVPVIAKFAEMFSNWEFRVVPRDDFTEEVESFYSTAGRLKIPLIVFADEDGDEILRWAERPLRSYQLIVMLRDQNLSKEDYLKEYGRMDEFKPPSVSEEIFRELVEVADRVASIVKILPPKRK